MSPYVIAILASVSLLSAQQAPSTAHPHDPAKQFKKLDKDGDGRLSLVEFQAKGKDPAKREKRFHKLDANQDNYLSIEEFSAARVTPAK